MVFQMKINVCLSQADLDTASTMRSIMCDNTLSRLEKIEALYSFLDEQTFPDWADNIIVALSDNPEETIQDIEDVFYDIVSDQGSTMLFDLLIQ